MKNSKRILSGLMAAGMAASLLTACGGSSSSTAASTPASTPAGSTASSEAAGGTGTDYKIAVVPKMTNIAWFQRMEEGVDAYNEETGSDIFYGGSAEGADQASYVESLLAEDWDAICVVPFDVEAIGPVLQKAKLGKALNLRFHFQGEQKLNAAASKILINIKAEEMLC